MKFKFTTSALGIFIACHLNAQGTLSPVKLSNIELAYPYWSPDDSWIAYQSNQTGNWEIYMMRNDGSGIKQLTHNGHNNITPAVSPDGIKIAFVSDLDGDNDIYIMDLQGNVMDKITHNTFEDYHPSWSPSGQKITYGSGATESATEIFEFDLTTRQSRQLTDNDHFDSFSDYSPDGSKIVWIKWLPHNNGELYVLDLGTNEEKRITNSPGFEGYCTWNAAGDEIYYAFPNPDTKSYDIGKVNYHTLKKEIIFSSSHNDARPQISHDGSRMVFNREVNGDMNISILNLPTNPEN